MPDFFDVFTPFVFLKNQEGKLEKLKIFVYLGFKTVLVTLFKPDYQFTYSFIRRIQAYMSHQVVVLSHLLDQQISKPLPSPESE
jgi:hypothetical protein